MIKAKDVIDVFEENKDLSLGKRLALVIDKCIEEDYLNYYIEVDYLEDLAKQLENYHD